MSEPPGFRAYNFRQIHPRLATSGVVPREEFEAIAAAGYRLVINLLPSESQYALNGEALLVNEHGMDYIHIPVDIKAPTIADFDRFAEAMDGAKRAPVWVHCAANWRVSAFVTLYGERRLDWSPEQGQALIADIWEPDDVWREFMRAVRALHDSEAGRSS